MSTLKILQKKCFKKFMDNMHVVKETTLAVEKKPLVLVLVEEVEEVIKKHS